MNFKFQHLAELWKPIFLATFLLLLLSGCASETDTGNVASDNLSADLASGTSDEKITSKKDYEQKIDVELEKMRLDVNSVQAKLSTMGIEVDQETEQSVIVFNREMEEFAQTFQTFQQASNGNWEEAQKKTDSGLAELRDVLFIMRTQVETAYGRYQPDKETGLPTASL